MDVERFLHAKAPHLHLLVATPSTASDLMWSWQQTEGKRVAVRALRGNKMATAARLFDEFAAALQFPYYFGENWDAFDECLRDLEWLEADAYVIVITHAQQVLDCEPPEELQLFFKLLEATAREWGDPKEHDSKGPPKPFHVVLQCTEEEVPAVKARLKAAGARADLLG
jgi:hypothetical protein